MTRSSARVSPRSVIRVAAISATTCFERGRARPDAAGAAHVADRAVAHRRRERLLAVDQLDVGRHRVEHPVALEHVALVREVDRRHLELLLVDVAPHVQLGPVGEGEHAHVLAPANAPVVEGPQLGPLRLGVPLAEVVAEREDPLLGPGPLLVAAGAPEGGVEAVLGERVEQRGGLEPVARRAGALLLDHAPGVDRVLHRGHDQPLAELLHAAVAELDHLGEVVARVDVHHREREPAGPECLLGQPQEHDRVLAAGEEQHGTLQLGRHLAKHVDRLRLEDAQVRQLGLRRGIQGDGGGHSSPCRPHSVCERPAQRPSRPPPGRVHGAQPIEA